MKLNLLVIVSILGIIKLSLCQVFDYGEIINQFGKCLTLTVSDSPAIFTECSINGDQDQVFNFNFGASILPTFKSVVSDLCIHVNENKTIIGYDCKNGIISNKNKWSVKNTGDNQFYLINNHYRQCLTSEKKVYVKQCRDYDVVNYDENEDTVQRFTYRSLSPYIEKVTYNVDSFKLIPTIFLDSQSINAKAGSYQDLNYKISGYKLKFEKCMLRVYNPSNKLIWSNKDSDPSDCEPSATLKMQKDENLCIYTHEDYAIAAKDAIWCSYTVDTGARYFTFMPPYSYGREFGIVLLNSQKQMVWGQFGKAVIPDASYILIPGNFIDKLNPTKNTLTSKQFITNGRDYVRFSLNNDGRLRLSRGAVTRVELLWITKLPTIKGPYSFAFGPDSNFCIKNNVTSNTGVWCTMTHSTTSRYIQVPLLDAFDKSFWGWVVQDGANKLTYGAFNLPPDTDRFCKENNDYSGNYDQLNKVLSSKTITATHEDRGQFRATIPLIGHTSYISIGYGFRSEQTFLRCTVGYGTTGISGWYYIGYWNDDGSFSLTSIHDSGPNRCAPRNDYASEYFRFRYSTLRSPRSRYNRFVAATGFPELFILNGDGIMGYNMPF